MQQQISIPASHTPIFNAVQTVQTALNTAGIHSRIFPMTENPAPEKNWPHKFFLAINDAVDPDAEEIAVKGWCMTIKPVSLTTRMSQVFSKKSFAPFLSPDLQLEVKGLGALLSKGQNFRFSNAAEGEALFHKITKAAQKTIVLPKLR